MLPSLALTLLPGTDIAQAAPAHTTQASERQASSTIVRSKFYSLPVGPIGAKDYFRALGGNDSTASLYRDQSIVRWGSKGHAIRTHLAAGTYYTSNGGPHGIATFVALPKPVNRACLRYGVRFDKHFDWSMGGKLPGLEGVAPGVAAGLPGGGHPAGDKGWSGRMMWRGPKAVDTHGGTNRAVSYMYSPHQKDKYGDVLSWNVGFTPGRWHQVKQCYVMNTVGRSDGVLRTWFDGRPRLDVTDYVYRTRQDVAISHIAWSVFRGGNTQDWAGRHDDSIDIRRVAVTAY